MNETLFLWIYNEKYFKFVFAFAFGARCIFAIRDVGLFAEASPSTSPRFGPGRTEVPRRIFPNVL